MTRDTGFFAAWRTAGASTVLGVFYLRLLIGGRVPGWCCPGHWNGGYPLTPICGIKALAGAAWRGTGVLTAVKVMIGLVAALAG